MKHKIYMQPLISNPSFEFLIKIIVAEFTFCISFAYLMFLNLLFPGLYQILTAFVIIDIIFLFILLAVFLYQFVYDLFHYDEWEERYYKNDRP